MTHEIKRSKNFKDSIPSSSGDKCSIPATSDESQSQEWTLDISAGERVFGIDLIREEILKYVIYDNSQKISSKLIKSIRLVQRSWLSTVTKLLKKCKNPPLVQVTLALNIKAPFILMDSENKNGQLLDKFIATFGASTRLNSSYLPYKIKLGSEFFIKENHQKLSTCFTRLGSDLSELEIIYPQDGGNMPVNFPPFLFPKLRKLSFQFEFNFYRSIFDDPSHFTDNKFGLWLLQSILYASRNLQEFVIPFTCGPLSVVPAAFEFLQLPTTIVSLQLELQLESQTLETFFQQNELPNLKNLTLQLHDKPLAKDVLYNILEQFRKTLVNLQVDGLNYSSGRPVSRTYLRFPVMEKLEFLNIVGTECELEAEHLASLEACLPTLNRIYLVNQTEAMLKKWSENLKFENVKELLFSSINEHLSYAEDNFYKSPSLEIMTKLNAAFPNVTDLIVHVNIGSLDVLEYLFVNMKGVEKLEIVFHGRLQENSSDLVDSMLMGIPLTLVSDLKGNRSVDNLESDLVRAQDESQSSIRNLSELTTLSLGTENETGGDGVSLVSDLLFGQTFMRMPKLHNLYLHGKFQLSDNMQNEWKEQGRFLWC